jgi:thiol-disulfide isomerase/thioredoxin
MTGSRLALIGAAVLFAGVGVGASWWLRPPEPATAEPAAHSQSSNVWEYRLPDLAGREQDLAQWRGKVVVINFWATWCPPCREEIPAFIRLQERYAKAGVQFLGLAVDEKEAVSLYARETGFNYPLLLASEQAGGLFMATGNELGGLPYTVVYDRQGKEILSHAGLLDEARLDGLLKAQQ